MNLRQHIPGALKNALPEGVKQHLRPWLQRLTEPKPLDYYTFRNEAIDRDINNPEMLARFRDGRPLPQGFGHRLDERAVEYPWFLSRVKAGQERLLDLGSTLNFEFLLKHPLIAESSLTIATLAPEPTCFWQRGVSYVFCDARELPFRDSWFDAVVCISTLEHIGMDNTLYYSSSPAHKEKDLHACRPALLEIQRVLKPGGTLYLTLPFGRQIDYGWFQQFDAAMVDGLCAAWGSAPASETVFRYEQGGWQLSDRASCRDCAGFHDRPIPESTPNQPVASEAVIALELRKPGGVNP